VVSNGSLDVVPGAQAVVHHRRRRSATGGGLGGWTLTSGNGSLPTKSSPNSSAGAALFHGAITRLVKVTLTGLSITHDRAATC